MGLQLRYKAQDDGRSGSDIQMFAIKLGAALHLLCI